MGLIKAFIIGILIASGIAIVFFAYMYESVGFDAKQLIEYKPEISSVIYDRNGKRLAYIFKHKHRLYARYDELPPKLVEGVVAMEDTKFFEHKGINPDAILRAAIKDIKAGRFVEGGSTITQQLIKNKVLSSKKKLMRKLKEAVLALKIEHQLTKEQILERYLNEIAYGNNYYGVKTAAQGYFHKNLDELTLKEIAMLVGLPNAPSFYNPLRHYKRCLNRANNVLYRMRSLGWITQEEYLQAVKESPKVYRTALRQNIAPYIVDEVLRTFKKKFGDIRTGGYRIYTTVDMKVQEAAKHALTKTWRSVLKRYGEDANKTNINGAMVVIDNDTGDILALVGGVDYRKSAFNRATQSKRQPGSSFKPFIYQTALDMGYNPATPIPDLARTFQYTDARGRTHLWQPKNYEHNFEGFISLREALVHSRNLATINLVADIGVETIRRRLALLDVPHIPKDLSIALGNLGLSPLKMAQIYTVFSNGGHMIEPRLVSKIVSKEGAVIFETRPKEIANFTTPEQAYLMTDILKDVIKRGTGRKAAVKGIELAGKTGTTNKGVDAWFCGYSPELETIVWFGRDNNKPIGKNATGGGIAAPAFARFYQRILTIYPDTNRTFVKPQGVYEGIYQGKKELYTLRSPLPKEVGQEKTEEHNVSERNNTDAPYHQDEDGYWISDDSDIETIDYDTLDEEDVISDEHTRQKPQIGIDPLHPPKIAPKIPASVDSGTLF